MCALAETCIKGGADRQTGQISQEGARGNWILAANTRKKRKEIEEGERIFVPTIFGQHRLLWERHHDTRQVIWVKNLDATRALTYLSY